MSQTKRTTAAARRMAIYRRKSKKAGRHRFEVNLPMQDAELIRYAVDRIREGGEEAQKIRALLEESKQPQAKIAHSTQELYQLFRESPLVGFDLTFERDKSLPRPVDLF